LYEAEGAAPRGSSDKNPVVLNRYATASYFRRCAPS